MPAIFGTPGNDVLRGTESTDQIEGLGGNDLILGGGDNDRLYGGDGDDAVAGEDGDDHIEGGAGADVLYGDPGRDLLLGGADNDRLHGGDGDDAIAGEDGDDHIEGGAGADVLYGDAGRDLLLGGADGDQLYGGDADDSLDGGDGDDLLVAGDGDDRLYGGLGVDILRGELGRDLLLGGAGNDGLYGGDGDDAIAGEDGDDRLEGGAGADVLYGDAGRDLLLGGADNDRLYGGDGDDAIAGEAGDDHLEGGVGADVLYGDAGGDALFGGGDNDSLHGGDGNDRLDGGDGDDMLAGEAGDDRLDGGLGADALYGGLGLDTLFGGSGNDQLFGGDNNDLLVGGADDDRLFGEAGDDLIAGDTGDDHIQGGIGADVLHGDAGRDLVLGGADNDQLYGEDGDDVMAGEDGDDYLEGGIGADALHGDAGRDLLLGGADNDHLYGGHGDDRLDGGLGADALYGGSGLDVLLGGGGHDLLYGGDHNDLLLGGADNDRLFGESGDDAIAGEDGDDHLEGGIGADVLYGDAGRDLLLGGADNDQLHGGDGDDAIAGEDGEDYLDGGIGADVLYGDAGRDVLVGGSGADILTGGAGGDTFRLLAAMESAIGAADSISDFETGLDRVDLTRVDANSLTAAHDSFLFIGAQTFTGRAGELRVVQAGSQFDLFGDTNGDGTADLHIRIVGNGVALSDISGAIAAPATNQAPVITSGTTATIAENSPPSTIVYQVAASDPDGNPLTYTLGGADAALFTIDQNGAVRFIQSPDFEARSSYSFSVQASDGSLAAIRGVTVTVTDVNEGVSSTPVINEISTANDTIPQAQAVLRSQLAVAPNPSLPDPSLPSVQLNGSISPLGDRDFFSITLEAGELLILDVDGTNSLDSVLRVYGPNGLLVAENDDPGGPHDPGSSAHSGIAHNLDSLIRFRAQTSGTYTFSIESYADGDGPSSSGSYIINLSVGPPAPQSVIDEENIDALISGSRWNTPTVTYGFTTDATQYPGTEGSPEKTDNFEALNPTQRAVTATTFGFITHYTGLAFSENVAAPGSAQIRLAQSDDPETAHAYYPGLGDGGDAWFRNHATDSNTGSSRFENPTPGNYGYLTFLHEIGHAMGLKHGHESPALSPDRDSMEFSIMTYRGYIGANYEDGGYKNETWGFAQTFMMYDIAALQKIYGANFNAQSGDTTYSWNQSTGAFSINGVVQWTPGGNRIFHTLWDGGGTDTYDLSSYGLTMTIDLRPGEWSKFSAFQLANLGDGNQARGNVANALLFNGDTRSLIENVIGGTDNDLIIANQAQNRLTGSAGANTFQWNSVQDAGLGSTADIVTDFKWGPDQIDLRGIDAIAGTAANDAFSLIRQNAFSGTAGELRYEVAGTVMRVFGDVNGDSLADFEIVVNAAPSTTLPPLDSQFLL